MHLLREYLLWTFFGDLDLDTMTFIYELEPHCMETDRLCKCNFLHEVF